MSEKARSSPEQLGAMLRVLDFYGRTLEALTTYLENGSPIALSTLERLLLENSKRKNRYIPDCHVLPKFHMRAMYLAAPLSTDPYVLNRVHKIVSTNPMKPLTDDTLYSVNEYIPVCCIGTLLEHLNKRVNRSYRGKPKPISATLAALLEKYGPDMYLVKPIRYIDVCDIVACPDLEFIKTLPDVVQERIGRFHLQYVYEKL